MMSDRHFGEHVEDNFTGFRPIILYDSQVDVINESLTLSQSRKDLFPDFDALSSHELDEIDAKCSVQNQDRIASDTTSHSSLQERSVAVDDGMFYYRALGSLRSELVPIKLFDRSHVGLAVSALASGSTTAFLRAGYRPLLLSALNHDFHRTLGNGTALLNWGVIFSVFLGLVSDCVPIHGTRRKAYIVLGWVLSTISFASVWAIHVWALSVIDDPDAIFGRLVEILSITGSVFLQLSWVAALALVVGFGQREAMSERGGLAISILILWQIGALIVHFAVAEFQSSLTLRNTSAILASISVLVLPFALWLLQEDDEQGSTAILTASTKQLGVMPALRTGILQLWEICQEIVTHRVLLFLVLYGMLLRARDPSVTRALATWSGFRWGDYANDPWVLVIMGGGTLSALLYAKWRLLRTAWRHLALYGTGTIVITALIQATVITTDTVRSKWFYAVFTVIRAWPTSWLVLFTVLTTTEIAHVGCEGVTMGFVLSGQAIGSAVMNAVAEWISHPLNAQSLIFDDSLSTRARILFAAVAYAAVNSFSALAVFLLPRSKLETQQLRAFGGHDRKGAALIVVLFGVWLALAIIANIMK